MNKIPFFNLSEQTNAIRKEVDQAISGVVDNTTFVLGPGLEEFEEAFATYCGAKYCAGTSSGTSALHSAMIAFGVGEGDEVITVANTFIATVEAIAMTGARPVVVDVLEDTGLMDAAELKALDQIYDMTSATGLRRGAAQQANTQLRKGERLMTSLFAALSMKVVPGNSLIMAGAAKQWMKDQMLKVPDPNVMLALETMTKNPAAFKRAVDKYKPKDEKGMQAMLTAMLKDAAGWVTGITTPPLMVQSGDDNTLRPN